MKNYTVVPFDTQNDGLVLIGYLYQPEGEGPFDCAIICHGFYDDLNNNTDIAEALASKGMIVINFDFNEEKVTTSSELAEVKDLENVIEKAKQVAELKNIYLIGINQGALISALSAKKDETDVSKLVLLNPTFIASESTDNSEEIVNANMLNDIKGFNKPTLIFHKPNDENVSASYSEKAAEFYSNCNLVEVSAEELENSDQASQSTINDIIEFLEK